MFVTVIFILSVIIIWCDWVAYRRFVRGGSLWIRWVVGLLLVAANLLPYIAVAMLWLFDMQSIVPMMWLLTLYTILSASRIALYCGVLTIKNRYAKWAVGSLLCTIVACVLIVGVVRIFWLIIQSF